MNIYVILFIVIVALVIFRDSVINVIALVIMVLSLLYISRDRKTINITYDHAAGEAIPSVDFTKPSAESMVAGDPVGIHTVTSTVRDPPNQDIYGPYYAEYDAVRRAYTDSYKEPQPRVGMSCAERNYDIDAANSIIAAKRTVDRQRNDGWASKDSEYYKYHFAEELEQAEDLRWWGRNEW